jgi:hypothetical protein
LTDPLRLHCEPCPYGGSCRVAGNVFAAAGFWGSSSSSSSSSSSGGGSGGGGSGNASAAASLSFFRCPSGYCCDGGATPCAAIGGCAANRSGALCGACPPGFAQTIGSPVHRAAAECGGADAAWFVLGALLLAALFALYALHAPAGGDSGWPLNAV